MSPWQQILRTNIRSLPHLYDFLELQPSQRKKLTNIKGFGINIPLRLAKKMDKGSVTDPLFLQFVPLIKEEARSSCFTKDPVEDEAFREEPKLLIKYSGRALLLTASACAMHCRYCFRRHFAYDKERGYAAELRKIADDSSLKEVILSGGDPLSLTNDALEGLLSQIEAMPHIRRLRFHSRFLMGIPERIDEGFLALLARSKKQVYFVIHSNHARELDEEVIAAVHSLQKLGVVVLNQAVLLKGVNDSVEALEALMESCIDVGIIPYYLHQLDRVEGAMHFEVEQAVGRELMKELRGRTSGFGQFRYVEEIPHQRSKTALF